MKRRQILKVGAGAAVLFAGERVLHVTRIATSSSGSTLRGPKPLAST